MTEDPELSESDSDFDSEDEDVDEEELVESDAEEDNCAHYASPDLTPIPVVAAAAAAAAAVFSSLLLQLLLLPMQQGDPKGPTIECAHLSTAARMKGTCRPDHDK